METTTTMEMTTAMTTAMTTDMTTDATSATTDPTGGGGNICDPDPMDDMCVACVKMNCCPQLEACEMDGDETMGCACFQACVAEGGAPVGQCDGQCGVNVFDMGSPTGALGGCTLGMCAAECPLG